MAVSPALAHDRDRDGWDEDFGFWVFVPVFFFDVDFDGVDDNFDCDFVYCNGFDYNDFDSDDEDSTIASGSGRTCSRSGSWSASGLLAVLQRGNGGAGA